MKAAKIVITGGPSGGKTTLIDALKKDLGPDVTLIPEAASILYRGGFPRLKGTNATKHIQKAIYYSQKELEQMLMEDAKKARITVCDRGSLDGVAYWPTTEKDFLKAIGSSRRKELARYDWVLHLDTAPRGFYDSSNPLRTESIDEAVTLNERIKRAWRDHPRRFVITQNDDFLSKMTLCLAVIRAIAEGRSADKIWRELLAD